MHSGLNFSIDEHMLELRKVQFGNLGNVFDLGELEESVRGMGNLFWELPKALYVVTLVHIFVCFAGFGNSGLVDQNEIKVVVDVCCYVLEDYEEGLVMVIVWDPGTFSAYELPCDALMRVVQFMFGSGSELRSKLHILQGVLQGNSVAKAICKGAKFIILRLEYHTEVGEGIEHLQFITGSLSWCNLESKKEKALILGQFVIAKSYFQLHFCTGSLLLKLLFTQLCFFYLYYTER